MKMDRLAEGLAMAINRRTAEDLASIPLTGRIRMAGPLGQHRPAEEIRRGALLSGVNVFAEGHYADVAPGKLRLDADVVLEVPL